MKNQNPTETKAWKKLQELAVNSSSLAIREELCANMERVKKFTFEFDEIYLDLSKNHINENILECLLSLANECGLTEAKKDFFEGRRINETENRAVLHTALRNFDKDAIFVEGINQMPAIEQSRNRIENFSRSFYAGQMQGFSGKTLNKIIHIGIGGSDLGPAMIYEAMKGFSNHPIQANFVSNVDGAHLHEALKNTRPDECLFVIASKTFTTQETMANAKLARQWIVSHYGGDERAVACHFAAVSCNYELAGKFGVTKENIFEFADWVGGRFSLWSPIGLSVACALGYDVFEELLKGAESIDKHFKNAPHERNFPVLLGLLGIWYRNFMDAPTHAIIPYNQYLSLMPAWLQQTDMESNGKQTDRNGNRVNYPTGPVIWGAPGSNAQHAFFQWIHQGTDLLPCDFIAFVSGAHPYPDMQELLLDNFAAQTEALLMGRAPKINSDNNFVERFRTFEGNKPSTTILFKTYKPYSLGQLIALYEHKIFVQGIIWNIFSFDQWGVELGKEMAKKIETEKKEGKSANHDFSTNNLLEKIKLWRTFP